MSRPLHKCNLRKELFEDMDHIIEKLVEFQDTLVQIGSYTPVEKAENTYYWRDADTLIKEVELQRCYITNTSPTEHDREDLASKAASAQVARNTMEKFTLTHDEQIRRNNKEHERGLRWDALKYINQMILAIEQAEIEYDEFLGKIDNIF